MRPTFFIAVFLLGFGLFFNLLTPSGLGLFDTAPLPTSTGMDMEMITQLTEAGSASEQNPIGGVTVTSSIWSVLLNAVINVIYIVPVATALGIPAAISYVFELMLILVYAFDLFLLIRGLTQ